MEGRLCSLWASVVRGTKHIVLLTYFIFSVNVIILIFLDGDAALKQVYLQLMLIYRVKIHRNRHVARSENAIS